MMFECFLFRAAQCLLDDDDVRGVVGQATIDAEFRFACDGGNIGERFKRRDSASRRIGELRFDAQSLRHKFAHRVRIIDVGHKNFGRRAGRFGERRFVVVARGGAREYTHKRDVQKACQKNAKICEKFSLRSTQPFWGYALTSGRDYVVRGVAYVALRSVEWRSAVR